MASFKALNIESDDESDIVVDDTKEIQIEEALKLYQTALKHHSEGPTSFELAAKAYEELFRSEIFQYPESQNELLRIELLGAASDTDTQWTQLEDLSLADLTTFGIGSSSLPQILHLSHKNYAQFKLDSLAARLDSLQASVQQILAEANEALDHFVSALDKDDADTELWRNTAAVASLLDSRRVARLCLEASLDNDDEGLQTILNIPSFEDSLADQQLTALTDGLGDYLTRLQTAYRDPHEKALLRRLRFNVNLFQLSIDKILHAKQAGTKADVSPNTYSTSISLPRTWLELGEKLLSAKTDESLAIRNRQRTTVWQFELPTTDTPYLTPPQDSVPHGSESQLQDTGQEILPPDLMSATMEHLTSGNLPLKIETSTSDLTSAEGQPVSAISDVSNKQQHDSVLPSRKRSTEAAGLADNGEEGRSRSKRIRARDSLADPVESKQALQDANVQWEYEQHLAETQAADDWLYESVGPMFARIGVGCLENIKSTKALLKSTSSQPEGKASDSVQDAQLVLHEFFQNYNAQIAQTLLLSGAQPDLMAVTRASNKDNATGHARRIDNVITLPEEKLRDFIETENDGHRPFQDIATNFIMTMMFPGRVFDIGESSYVTHTWQDQFKSVLVRLVTEFDTELYQLAIAACESIRSIAGEGDYEPVRDWLQNMFELHLETYILIRRGDGGIDDHTAMLQAERLERWFEILREVAQMELESANEDLDIRLLWSSTFYIATLSDVSQDRALAYMQDLRERVVAYGRTLQLVNNSVMPEISLVALDKEISQLTTKDFFDKVSSMNSDDPAALIDMIEPLLEAVDARKDLEYDGDLPSSTVPIELITFLENSGPASVLQLWHRLLDAYIAIGYKPMITRTLFRIMRLVIEQIEDPALQHITSSDKVSAILSALRLVQHFTSDILETMQQSGEACECLDENDLHNAVMLYDKVLRLLQIFNVFEDPIRIGRDQVPMLPNGSPMPSFEPFSRKLHEMQLQIWMVLYGLLQEAIKQNEELFLTPDEDRFDFLRTLHRNLGIREICGGLNQVFIRMIRDEFFKLSHVDGYDSEQAQVLYDLYGLNCFLRPDYELMEHRCTHDAFLDKESAQEAVDMLLIQTQRLSIKELVKHTLKDAIDKVHGALIRKKPTDAILRNREAIRTFLRSPINPAEIFRSFRGEGNMLYTTTVPEGDAILAAKGWYYLMGHIALVKFRTTKRTGPTPTEDIDIAIAFFMQELEYSTSQWETWFRLGQAYDTKLEESVAWSSEKLNSSMSEIIQLQRAVIHCFSMAVALAFRSASPTAETSDKMTELYAEFAMRIYTSSRAPFSMLVFTTDIPERYLSRRHGIEKEKIFEPLTPFAAWKLAKVLFQRALAGNSQPWTLHYNLAKCLWKMHNAPNVESKPSIQDVFNAIYQAIETMPKRDTRDTKREPVLEPHYKLVSIIHKLVTRDKLDLETAREALEHTIYAKKVDFPQSKNDWTEYILLVLKAIRAADKANWHHRMIARSAQIIYEDSRVTEKADRAAAAKHELTQQLFTKTMVLQVWRPEAERPGRHFVYCARYTRFFVKILEVLKDRNSLDLLARRVRRRTHEIFEHSIVWQDIVSTYLRLLRARAGVAEGLEISTFSIIFHEDFLQRKEPLEKWMQGQEGGKNVVLDVLREVLELKKINQNLMKTGPIDDLIGDSYAHLLNTVGRQLWEDEKREQLEREATEPVPMPQPEPEPAPAPRNVMNLAHMMNTIEPELSADTPAADSTAETDVPAKRKPGVGRREIRTAAEACVYKPPSAHGSARHSVSSESAQALVQSKAEPNAEDVNIRDESVNGSIDDDADDESELSVADYVSIDGTTEEVEGNAAAAKSLFQNINNQDSGDKEGDKDSEEEPVLGR